MKRVKHEANREAWERKMPREARRQFVREAVIRAQKHIEKIQAEEAAKQQRDAHLESYHRRGLL